MGLARPTFPLWCGVQENLHVVGDCLVDTSANLWPYADLRSALTVGDARFPDRASAPPRLVRSGL